MQHHDGRVLPIRVWVWIITIYSLKHTHSGAGKYIHWSCFIIDMHVGDDYNLLKWKSLFWFVNPFNWIRPAVFLHLLLEIVKLLHKNFRSSLINFLAYSWWVETQNLLYCKSKWNNKLGTYIHMSFLQGKKMFIFCQ